MTVVKQLVYDEVELRRVYTNPIVHESAYGEALYDYTGRVGQGYKHMVYYAENGAVVGAIPFKQVNRLMAEVHIHVMPEYWGTNLSIEMALDMKKWLKINTTYLKVLTWLCSEHEYASNYVGRLGFKKIDSIPGSGLYRGKVCDTVLYYADLYGTNK